MKLLFDENLPGSLPQRLADLFPGSVHVRDVGLKQAADSVIWEFAVTQGFVIVSKDSDYRQMSALRGKSSKGHRLARGQLHDRYGGGFAAEIFRNDPHVCFGQDEVATVSPLKPPMPLLEVKTSAPGSPSPAACSAGTLTM